MGWERDTPGGTQTENMHTSIPDEPPQCQGGSTGNKRIFPKRPLSSKRSLRMMLHPGPADRKVKESNLTWQELVRTLEFG